MVAHEREAEQVERVAQLRLSKGANEGAKIAVIEEDVFAIIATVNGVVDQAIGHRS